MSMAGVSSRAAPRPTKRIIVASLLLLTLLFPLLSFFPSSSEKKPAASDVQGAVAEGRLALVTETLPGSDCAHPATAREEEGNRVVQALETEERSKAFEKIFATDFWGGGESRSGPGSRIDYTANVRTLVAHAIKEYHVQHILDAPCGGTPRLPLQRPHPFHRFIVVVTCAFAFYKDPSNGGQLPSISGEGDFQSSSVGHNVQLPVFDFK